jgi:hypothetical protein
MIFRLIHQNTSLNKSILHDIRQLSAAHRLEEVYLMSVQLAIRLDEVPITCETQQRMR